MNNRFIITADGEDFFQKVLTHKQYEHFEETLTDSRFNQYPYMHIPTFKPIINEFVINLERCINKGYVKLLERKSSW